MSNREEFWEVAVTFLQADTGERQDRKTPKLDKRTTRVSEYLDLLKVLVDFYIVGTPILDVTIERKVKPIKKEVTNVE